MFKEAYNNVTAPQIFIDFCKHHTKEFKDFSEMSLSQIWEGVRIQEFLQTKNAHNKIEEASIIEQQQQIRAKYSDFSEIEIQNLFKNIKPPSHLRQSVPLSETQDHCDFFLVLKGHCYLNLHVSFLTRTLEDSEEASDASSLKTDELQHFIARFFIGPLESINSEALNKFFAFDF